MEHFILSCFIAFASIAYIIYLALTSSIKIKSFFISQSGNNVNHILFQRLTGILIFGILPLLSLILIFSENPAEYGINFTFKRDTLIWLIILGAVIIPMNYFNSKRKENLDLYPQMRNIHWSAGLVIVSALSWIIYLLGYEILFRGLLLFSAYKVIGYWPAIILNTGIYSLAHYPKGIKEALGAIPFGIIICILSIKTGSFLLAFIVHCVLALSNEWFSILAHQKNTQN